MSSELKVSRLMRSLAEDNSVPAPCHVDLDASLFNNKISRCQLVNCWLDEDKKRGTSVWSSGLVGVFADGQQIFTALQPSNFEGPCIWCV